MTSFTFGDMLDEIRKQGVMGGMLGVFGSCDVRDDGSVKVTLGDGVEQLFRKMANRPTMVICNNPATVVMFGDGTKTVTKTHEGDEYSWLTGIAFCCLRKALRNRRFDIYEKQIRKLVTKAYERDPRHAVDELHAIADALNMTADAMEVEDA